jgi:hypothetical protein
MAAVFDDPERRLGIRKERQAAVLADLSQRQQRALISAGTAPPIRNRQVEKDIGFNSYNRQAYTPLLKGLSSLTDSGPPQER